MLLALALASRGRGAVEPNPMVGAVIVRDGRLLGEGWHRRFGGPHAEREALAAAQAAGHDVAGATMYVTLEPCRHQGKTPPCTDAILEARIARVVVAMQDPDVKVSGGGTEALRAGGVDVTVGLCRAEASELMAPYVKLRTEGRPWVICKWAQTADGYLALPHEGRRWVSGEKSREHVHRLRGRCDGICVGIGTVLADDPQLTNRSGAGRQPVRLVLDSRLRLPPGSQLARTAGSPPVIVAAAQESPKAEAMRQLGVEVLVLPAPDGWVDLGGLLDELGRREWTHLLVEGGPGVLGGFVDAGLADELLVYVSPVSAGPQAGELPQFDIAAVRDRLAVRLVERRVIGDDEMLRYRLAK